MILDFKVFVGKSIDIRIFFIRKLKYCQATNTIAIRNCVEASPVRNPPYLDCSIIWTGGQNIIGERHYRRNTIGMKSLNGSLNLELKF